MDPFAVVSFCCNVLDLADRSVKIFKICQHIYNSPDGQDHGSPYDTILHAEELIAEWGDSNRNLVQEGKNGHDDTIIKVLEDMDKARKELQRILDICKARKTQNVLATTVAAVKYWKSRYDINRLGKQLDGCRQQLDSLLTIRISQQVARIIDMLDNFGSALNDIRDSLKIKSRTKDVKGVRDASAKAKQLMIMRQVLQALGSPGERYDMVREATEDTFEWLFQEPDSSSRDDNAASDDRILRESFRETRSSRLEASESFRTWLLHGTGMFHISGKPGSGKSVLMKFIMEHKKTRDLLLKWAEGKQLVYSKFFFWKPGNWRQNTLRGLVRGLLYDVLDNQPNLVHDLFPQWSAVNLEYGSTPAYIPPMKISDKDCSTAFQRLLDAKKAVEDTQICFFIDGLDEFEDDHRYTHNDLVQKLRQWSDRSDGRVKLCVSSRELPAFENISPNNKIRLQDLTKSDICKYVLGTLRNNPAYCEMHETDPSGCAYLVRYVVSESHGVFLWASLVVQSISRGFDNGHSLAGLKTRVQEMPQELEELFDKIWASIDKCDLWGVTLVLAIAIRQYDVFLDDTLVRDKPNSWFMARLRRHRGFTLNDMALLILALDTSEPTVKALISSGAKNLCQDHPKTISRINGRWNGLLQVNKGDDTSRIVVLSHRSIIEFMRARLPRIAQDLEITNNDVETTMCWMFAERIKQLVPTSSFSSFQEKTEQRLDLIVELSVLLSQLTVTNGCLSDDTLTLLDDIDQIFEDRPVASRELQPGLTPVHFTDIVNSFPYVQREGELPIWSVLAYACYFGLSQFVSWKLAHPSFPKDGRYSSFFLYFGCWGASHGRTVMPEIFGILFDHGIDPNCRRLFGDTYFLEYDLTRVGEDVEITWFDKLWIALLLRPGTLLPWSALEIWLQYGAKSAALYSFKHRRLLEESEIEIDGTPISRRVNIRNGVVLQVGSKLIIVPDYPPESYRLPADCEEVTFEDLVKIRNPPNRDSILALLHPEEENQPTDQAAVTADDSSGKEPPERESPERDDGPTGDAGYRDFTVPVLLLLSIAAPSSPTDWAGVVENCRVAVQRETP
ncbi:hypothetical protein F5X99DRAFT_211872 [Biscogniauxia marginata]|nr:hypothetical protein F5X99DRAFT_211872 [Biscogniauxia marginata]